MLITSNAQDFRASNLVFVPTMGALHEGHASLIQQARQLSDQVVVSIFVNPLQFENQSDLEKYPRTPEKDAEVAKNAGATILWMPDFKDVYPGEVMMVEPGPIGNILEGASRPAHFQGVLTVVKRLFDLVQPKSAIFGEKDFQQLFLIKEMVRKLQIPISIVAGKTIRDADGLAISSRNVRLSAHDRDNALVIFQALTAANEMESLSEIQETLIETLSSKPEFLLDYACVVDEKSFEFAGEESFSKRALVAGWVNGVRLIDNMPMKARVR
ncbi:unannotated protein [freshwater metagenome]|uniref:pantoate--beta-alanine ligase (AMP-forming) n=1 Tax=freshwater metagenome TaxID=449393 RepID=A0A6J6WMV2_9ZZZZ|nr:pantoate--beta-alanine ligase [Actinomycetota bacterium]MSW23442.1 pantoate--beta-alanine ligase [Actinomycetota bacterium]MSW75505.1 pantoate--beta-alanine ligase [Actinomycetota bacterium]MSY30887.1 pantoate--beta-alanine ligase [Actinomycetota bacterium]